MSINQRQHIRFSLDIPVVIYSRFGERQETMLQQISIGGCFTDWEDNIYTGDEFRMEIPLPNGNRLPVHCKALYRFDNTGIGVKFLNITEFEQELISKIISSRLDNEGVPMHVDPFSPPPRFSDPGNPQVITDDRREREALLESIMSSGD